MIANSKLWVIVVVVIVLGVGFFLFSGLPATNSAISTADKDAAHDAFMVQGGSADHETNVAVPLGSGQPKQRP